MVLLALLLSAQPARAAFALHTDVFEPIFAGGNDGMGAGVAFFDLDGDGDDDVLVSHGPDGVRLYENGGEPDFEFTDITLGSGLPTAMSQAFGLAAADFDRDGDADVAVADRYDGVRLFENRGGTFVETTALALPLRPAYASSLAAGDLDGDGFADLWAAGYTLWFDGFFHHCAPDRVFHNRGDGTFDEVGDAWGIADTGCTLAVLMSDFDVDGDADVLLANDFGGFVRPNRLYRNDGIAADGGVRFVDVAPEVGFDRRLYGMGLATADVDGDGRPDYFETSIGRSVLLLGSEDGFTDATESYGVRSMFSQSAYRATWGASFLDIESDGLWDLAVAAAPLPAAIEINATGRQPLQLWSNPSDAVPAEDVAAEQGVAVDDIVHALAVSDFDRDGDDDLLVGALGGLVRLLRNDAEPSPTLSLRLRGTVSNPDGLGAQATLRCDGVERFHELAVSGSYASQHSSVLRLPLAGCDAGGTVALRWPSGLVETFAVAPEGGELVLGEPAWIAVEPAWLPADGASETTVRVTPRDAAGALLGTGRAVGMSVTAGAISAVTDVGDGSYRATWTAPLSAGSGALSVTVDGDLAPAHPRARFFATDRTLVRASRPEYVADRTDVVVTVVPKDAAGVPVGPGHDVDVVALRGTIVDDVADLGDGRYEAVVRGDGGGDLVVSASVDGSARGPDAVVREIAAVDPARTYVRVVPGAVAREDLDATDVSVLVSPRDGLGATTPDARDHVYEFVGVGGALVPIEEGEGTDRYSATFPAADFAAQSPVELRVDGVVLDRAADLLVYDDPSEVAAAVDTDRSKLAVYLESAYADGEDYLWVSARLEDAEGDLLPWTAGMAFESAGLTADFERGEITREARLRATGAPGTHVVDVTFDGEPIGVSTTAILLEPIEWDPDDLTIEVCLSETWRFADGSGQIQVAVRPRDRHDLLVGSNAPVALYLDGAEAALTYALPGAYLAAVPVAERPRRSYVQVELVGTERGATTWIDFLGPGDDFEDRPLCVRDADGYTRFSPEDDLDAGPDAAPGDPDAAAQPDAGPDGSANDVHAIARGGGCDCGSAPGMPTGWPFLLGALLRRRRL